MAPPILESLVESSKIHQTLPLVEGKASRAAFVVRREGWFEGTFWRAGSLIVCGPMSSKPSSQQVVLVPRGMGRPRLGTAEHASLFGDSGEPCSDLRWFAVGRVVCVVGPVRQTRPQVVDLQATIRAASTPVEPQLRLFAA